MADKRIYNLSSTTDITDHYIMVDKSGNADALRYDIEGLLVIRSGRVSKIAGTSTVTFAKAFPAGSDYALWVRAIDSSGYDIGAVDSNRTVSGFDITVDDSCTLEYIAAKL